MLSPWVIGLYIPQIQEQSKPYRIKNQKHKMKTIKGRLKEEVLTSGNSGTLVKSIKTKRPKDRGGRDFKSCFERM